MSSPSGRFRLMARKRKTIVIPPEPTRRVLEVLVAFGRSADDGLPRCACS
jgi:hypothetical protein